MKDFVKIRDKIKEKEYEKQSIIKNNIEILDKISEDINNLDSDFISVLLNDGIDVSFLNNIDKEKVSTDEEYLNSMVDKCKMIMEVLTIKFEEIDIDE